MEIPHLDPNVDEEVNLMRKKQTAMFVILLVVLLSGCAGVRIHAVDQHPKGMLLPDQATVNSQILSEYLKVEGGFYKDNTKPPCTCVAFSGGGIRSAAFSIGVMKGLHAINGEGGEPFLHQIDIMSAASGGAYGMSWYYMNQLGPDAISKDDLFLSPAQNYLLENADFMTVRRFVQGSVSDMLLIPWNLFANGFFGWHLNSSFIATQTYENAIRQTFHGNKPGDFSRMPALLKNNHLPFFIITTTAHIDEDQLHYDSLLSKRVFEFTPLRFGSDAFGYSDVGQDFPLTVAEAVEVSGAAIDSFESFTGARQKVAGSLLNIDTGRFIDNYKEKRSFLKNVGYWLSPAPFYLYQRAYILDAYGKRMRLSDGGHADNLAGFPLIRRLCSNIIIVDAEYDPHYSFGAYFKLKESIEREMHVTFRLTNGHHNVEAIPKKIEAGKTLESVSVATPPDIRGTFDPAHPVIPGKIGPFPIGAPFNEPDLFLNVTYIKMAIDDRFAKWAHLQVEERTALETQYGSEVTSYAVASLQDTCEKRPYILSALWKCSFPQYSTAHQNFSSEQFAAYVQLGERIVKNELTYDPGRKTLKISGH
ncbi:MAG: hypothetical protein HOP22_13520 [Nitrospiraceae bacterium]|nr:hypothetical protein [Nitrospiraceae bacterium]